MRGENAGQHWGLLCARGSDSWDTSGATENGPGGAANTVGPGPRPIRNLDEEIDPMPSIAPAQPAVSIPCCPTCGRVPASERTTVEHGIVTGNYICANDHLYVMRWLAGGA